MNGHRHDNIAPPAAVAMGVAMILLSLLLVASVRFGAVAAPPSASQLRSAVATAPAADRLLRVADQPDGTVLISDARTGAAIDSISREDGGFIRGVMRGLARERRQHRIGAEPPFRLTLWQTGQLSLADPSTGRVVELDGFGQTNRASFSRLLETRS